MHEASPSPVRFARVDGVAIAWQSWGDGPAQVVVVPPLAQNIELTWERPEYRALFARLGTFARVVHFDKRGTGASDRTDRMPTVDQRVEDLVAVMDAAGVERAHLLGLSEGGPVAIALAATYPERVESLTLFGSGARTIADADEAARDARRREAAYFHRRWGTEDTVTLHVFGPSAAKDPAYAAWQPRYERQSATPAALRELLDMVEHIDVRPLLGAVAAPTLLLHRRDDMVVSVDRARETAALLPHARLVELEGDDHFCQTGDIDQWIDHFERFVAGSISSRPAARPSRSVRIETMGGFAVSIDGAPVPASAWGSRQARLVCKRLAVTVGRPVPRDELADLLWPDELDPGKRSARLSVVLSNVRRALGPVLLADRDAVRLDLDAVDLDLATVHDAIANGDDSALDAAFTGPLLPEDAYDDWAIAARDRLSSAVISARRRRASAAASEGRAEDAIAHARGILDLDPFDERAHELLVSSLLASGRRGEAQVAAGRYEERMAELGVPVRDLLADR